MGAPPWPYANLRCANKGFGAFPEGGRPLLLGAGGATTDGAGATTGGGANDGLWDLSGALGCAFFLGAVRCATAFPLPLGTARASFNRVFFPVVFVT